MRNVNSRRQDRAAQYGVKKPKNKHKPINATNTSMTGTELRNERLVVSPITVTATTERKTIRATPAIPVGNIENSLCTWRK
jgi:hypothetical protein